MSYKGFKMCSFNASIGLLPLILIVSKGHMNRFHEDELYFEVFQGHTNRFHQDTEQNV